ncbi:hypothetical protein [Lapillicoccus sp.]|uniref:hypothetical protein n=1 Tax=Lapillicoccus sp. TaxID=1909287 RepID=UPI0025FEBF85|nr:hypothetical protein [Lapillicoccus sp.]
MNVLVMERSDYRVMLWHLALYGLAAICEEHDERVTIRWAQSATRQPRATLKVTALDASGMAELVTRHARTHASGSWLQEEIELNGTRRGLMSPRITPFVADDVLRPQILARRDVVLNALTTAHSWLDLQLLAALGQPAYWSRDNKGALMQDDGAGRLEMQPRNQGSEFIGSRLRKLAESVAARPTAAVLAGLTGAQVRDEIGKDQATSRTGTGLCRPGPVDNAVAWCALWGISQLPSTPRIGQRAITTSSGHLGRPRQEWFYLPYWEQPWRPARLRTVLCSTRLRTAAAAGLESRWAPEDGVLAGAQVWLRSRGVTGVLRFPIERFGSDSAPERRAMQAALVPVVNR